MIEPMVERKHVIESASELCQKLGLTLRSKFLGSGVDGCVFALSDRRVVKIATKDEAKIARLLVGRRLRHVVRVHSVHRVASRWLIVMERLQRHGKRTSVEDHPDVESAKRSLERLGVLYYDGHYMNIMKCPRTGGYKLIDFGHCSRKRGR